MDIQTNQDVFEHYKFTADEGQELIRLDKFLIDRIPNTSRTKIQEAVNDGHILVNKQGVKSNYKVKPKDLITVELPYPIRKINLIAENIPINIIYEDEDVLVVNKSAGMVVHPAYGNYTGTLVNAVLYHCKDVINLDNGLRPGIVHRLDKNTSGVMVVAKTELALRDLGKQFFEKTSKRQYEALVWGRLKKDKGTINGHVGRSLKNRKIMDVFPNGKYGKHAITHYKVLNHLDYLTHIQCQLETGRTHQIRVHMKHLGHPLFNDKEYGGDKILRGTHFKKYKTFIQNCFKTIPRQSLHAKSLGFYHPKTKEWMSFSSDLPNDFNQVLEKWNQYLSSRD